MSTLEGKVLISLNSALLFLLMNLPKTYKILSNNECPTNKSRLVHTFLFATFTFLSMVGSNSEVGIKLKHTIYGTLIYYLVSSPAIYSLTSCNYKCPQDKNVYLHSFVYFLSLIGVMYLPN